MLQGKVIITVKATLPYPSNAALVQQQAEEAAMDLGLEDIEVTVEDGYDGPLTQAGSDGTYAATH